MCPDKELISAYYDGETDPRWSDEIGTHIESCKECTDEFEKIVSLSRFIQTSELGHENEIKDRVYKSIIRKRSVVYMQPVWKRHYDVSFPMVAGAAALFVVLTAALIFGFQLQQPPGYMVEEIREEPSQIRAQVISIEDAAAYLLSDESGFDVLITIPNGEGLSLSGEPQLIREADYKRGQ